jgi:hypothetical protein
VSEVAQFSLSVDNLLQPAIRIGVCSATASLAIHHLTVKAAAMGAGVLL